MTLNYSVKVEKEKRKVNKFALINCIIGFPTIVLLGLLIGKGFLDSYLVLSYCAIGFLSLGMIYSIFILVKKQNKSNRNN